jgi:hypothetical protein
MVLHRSHLRLSTAGLYKHSRQVHVLATIINIKISPGHPARLEVCGSAGFADVPAPSQHV